MSTRILLLMILNGLLLSGCVSAGGPSSYRVTIPTWEAEPLRIPVDQDGMLRRYVAVIREDASLPARDLRIVVWPDVQKLIVELKAACLALGGTPKECQTE